LSTHPPDRVCSREPPRIKSKTKSGNIGFYARRVKRFLDIIFSALALILALPFLALIAAAVKLSSPGPVLFRQKRVGRDGAEFQILKFRSMCANAEANGPQITGAGDKRVTRVGSLLRHTKLDELPQFWNVLRGDMSLVGPRPEVPKYVVLYSNKQREVLSIRPGLTDFATVAYRHEAELLGRQTDPEQFYVNELMGRKLALNLRYVSEMGFLIDVHLLYLTVMAVLGRTCPNVSESGLKGD
jgi:lipopolysaccharide/colanic/teichoic acid biosynthesis glycosyltransferase